MASAVAGATFPKERIHMAPYIKINQLHMKNVPGSEISLTVEKGEIIGITGVNGSGKSTLVRYLSGVTRPGEMGKLLVAGLDPFSQLDNEKLKRLCSVVFQDPSETIVFENVNRDIVFGPENQGISRERILKKASSFIKKYDLKPKSKSYMQLSGGERQRAALSAALMMTSELIILDESFSMQSDKASVRYVDMIIREAKKKGQTVIIISKKKEILERMDRTYELSGGRLHEVDIEGMPVNSPMNFQSSNSAISRAYNSSINSNHGRPLDVQGKIYVERYLSNGESKSGNGISLHNVVFGYGKNLLFNGVNARYEAGSAYRIKGESASGKTTFLQLIGGLLKPFEGEIFIGENKKIGYVFQYSEDGFVEATVLDDVMFGPMCDGFSKSESREMARQVLRFVGVEETLWDRSPLSLSMGEQRLVSIAGALALNPDFLLIDEPFAGLDINSRKQMEDIIAALCGEGKCIITVEG